MDQAAVEQNKGVCIVIMLTQDGFSGNNRIRGYPFDSNLCEIASMVTGSEMRFLIALRSHMNPNHPTMTCFASHRTLAREMGVKRTSRTVAHRAAKALKAKGIIDYWPMNADRWKKLIQAGIVKERRRAPDTNEYRILFPWSHQVVNAMKHTNCNTSPATECNTSPVTPCDTPSVTNCDSNKQIGNKQTWNKQKRNQERERFTEHSSVGILPNKNKEKDVCKEKDNKQLCRTKAPRHTKRAVHEPSIQHLLNKYKGRSELDKVLLNQRLESEAEPTLDNFLDLHWDFGSSNPGVGAKMLLMRAYRDGAIPKFYRPKNYDKFQVEYWKSTIRVGREIMNSIDKCIQEVFPRGEIRLARRWKKGVYRKARLFRDYCAKTNRMWQAVLEVFVLAWPHFRDNYLDRRVFNFDKLFLKDPAEIEEFLDKFKDIAGELPIHEAVASLVASGADLYLSRTRTQKFELAKGHWHSETGSESVGPSMSDDPDEGCHDRKAKASEPPNTISWEKFAEEAEKWNKQGQPIIEFIKSNKNDLEVAHWLIENHAFFGSVDRVRRSLPNIRRWIWELDSGHKILW